MVAITIKIQSLEDAKNGKAIIDNVDISDLKEAKSLTVGILEKGTEGGQTSLMFLLEDGDGKTYHMAQCTANQFEAILGAFRGADLRFKGL
jgi:ApbE superfamily uncharacterized protein (UPF0280 family)